MIYWDFNLFFVKFNHKICMEKLKEGDESNVMSEQISETIVAQLFWPLI